MRPLQLLTFAALGLVAAPALTSCNALYFAAAEQLGTHVRDILVDRVVTAKETQVVAQEQFKTTLEVFQEAAGSSPDTKIEKMYKKLKSEYESCEKRADAVEDRVDAVEDASKRLFSEWAGEVEQITDTSYKADSARLRTQAMAEYDDLIAKMREAEAKMDPVLTAFKDRVLFLKANLNFSAISSLGNTLESIEGDVADLIADMQASIDEADAFIESMGGPDA